MKLFDGGLIVIQEGVAERFWALVDVSSEHECWNWKTGKTQECYPVFRGSMATHVSLALSGKVRPEGYFALHACDNHRCVNPNHLRWGTPKENAQEREERGRHWTPKYHARIAQIWASIASHIEKSGQC